MNWWLQLVGVWSMWPGGSTAVVWWLWSGFPPGVPWPSLGPGAHRGMVLFWLPGCEFILSICRGLFGLTHPVDQFLVLKLDPDMIMLLPFYPRFALLFSCYELPGIVTTWSTSDTVSVVQWKHGEILNNLDLIWEVWFIERDLLRVDINENVLCL